MTLLKTNLGVGASGRRRWFRGLLLSGIAVGSTAAAAQDVPQGFAPLRVVSDQNAVNIVSGKIVIPGPSLSVPAAPNLRFEKIRNAAPLMTGSSSGGGDSTSKASFSVDIGEGQSESFTCDDTDCTSVSGTGSIFTWFPTRNGNMAGAKFATLRQAGTGALWTFNLKSVDTSSTPNSAWNYTYYASSVEYPNGEIISYSYQTAPNGSSISVRPTKIDSTLGYYIEISYTNSTFSAADMGSIREVALYKKGDATPLGRLTYDANGITDLGGRRYVCGGCTDIEAISGSLQLPGEGSPSLEVTRHATAPVVTAVVRDGVRWTYDYLNPRPANSGTGYVYDKLTVTGPDGYRIVYDMDLSNLRNTVLASTVAVTGSISRTTRYEYDEAGRVKKIVLPEKNAIGIDYGDYYGNITVRTTSPKPNSLGLNPIVEQANFHSDICPQPPAYLVKPILCYRPKWSLDGLNRQTDYFYNDNGQLTEQVDPPDGQGIRRRQRIAYEPNGAGISRVKTVRICGASAPCDTANEIRTEYDYWGNTLLPVTERRIDMARGVTLTTTFDYDPAGRLLSTDGPLAGPDDATYNRYDVYGRKTWEIGPRSSDGTRTAKRFTYRDSDDKLIATDIGSVTDPANPILTLSTRTEITYDRRDPVREQVLRPTGVVQLVLDRSFNGRGLLVCEARRMKPAGFTENPGACAQTVAGGSQGPDRITHNIYDDAGQLVQVQRAYNTPLQQNYATYDYTLNGKQKAMTDANGNRAEMTFDGFDRQKRWIFPSNTPGLANQGDYEEYGYDAVGNRTSLRKRDGSTLTYAYDNLNRLIRKIVPERADLSAAQTRDVYFDYDVRGLPTKVRFDGLDGEGITNYYDGLGRLLVSGFNMAGAARYFDYGYDAADNRTYITHPDGVRFGFGYDAAGRMTYAHENGVPSGVDDYLVRYSYNPTGTRRAAVRGDGVKGFTTNYGYDPIQRLNAMSNDLPGDANDLTITFAKNTGGNIASRTVSNNSYAAPRTPDRSVGYKPNGLNQYAEVWDRHYLYDANGNLIDDGTTKYVYDVENRLVSASGESNANLVYDPLGRLFQTSGGAAGVVRFLYDGDNLVAEYDGSGTLMKRYVHGPNADDPVVVYDGRDLGLAKRRYMMPDERGSILALVNADGSPAVKNSYDAWGVPGSNEGRFQYTGQIWIPELRMYYYKARIYSSMLGRFMQTDPIGYADQMNLYAYAGNDPMNFNDPSGLKKEGTCTNPPACTEGVVDGPKRPPPGSAAHTPNGRGDSSGREKPTKNSRHDEYCRSLARDDTGKDVDPFIRNFPNVWNDISRLRFHENYTRQMAEDNEFYSDVGTGGSLGTAGVAAKIGVGFAAEAATFASIFVGAVSAATAYSARLQRAEANSIKARIKYLEAVEAGICPSR